MTMAMSKKSATKTLRRKIFVFTMEVLDKIY